MYSIVFIQIHILKITIIAKEAKNKFIKPLQLATTTKRKLLHTLPI